MKHHGNYILPNEHDVLVGLEMGDITFAEKTIRRLKKKAYNDKVHRHKLLKRKYKL